MGKYSLLRKGRGLHHPLHATASSIARGRHLEPEAIKQANKWQSDKVFELMHKPANQMTALDRRLLRNLMK